MTSALDLHPSRFHVYVQIAMILAVITGIEIVLVYLPIAKWFVVSALVLLSAVKFMFVIFCFMHLRWDKVFCTVLWALLRLFSFADSRPLSSILGLLVPGLSG